MSESAKRVVLSTLIFSIIASITFNALVSQKVLNAHATGTARRTQPDVSSGDWPTYLINLERQGFNGAETLINPTTAPTLKLKGTYQIQSSISSEPVVANGLVYWGSYDGVEHATEPSLLGSGADVWSTNLGSTSSCQVTRGVLSTAYITSVLIGGVKTTVDFVGGGDAQLYALDANTGAIIWKTRLGTSPSHFLYSSPAVFNGSVYIGVSSYDDCPVVQGMVFQVDAATGAIQNSFKVVPDGCLGGGVWGSIAVDELSGMLYFATGNGKLCTQPEPYTSAVVELRSSDLSYVGSWQVSLSLPNNFDFGATPTLFTTTIGGTVYSMLGVVNKNGHYYALNRENLGAGPIWTTRVARGGTAPEKGNASISSSSWDTKNIYVAESAAYINKILCAGSVRALNPATGKNLWRVCLNHSVLAPVISVPGLVIVASGPDMLVFDSATGNQLFAYHDSNTNSNFWGAATISHGVLYIGNLDGNLYAFAP